ncbi:response regulator [Usitatibacter palustris]|uniref:Polar-differentiation response regulator DivK n=1 Tax=Usitatibacter palustris TaxID=2732487 RepID=A0A6M4H324_9PROT|nr:response regulator [Usitatibacter palustris]QJR13969.1 Polar-differentiation response regulator DivK [Usitatibacter palustris]
MAGGWRVLIVDDSVDGAEILAMLLSSMGHETFVAHDGAGAISVAMEKRPDLILLDLRLPDVSGYEVAKRLRDDPSFATVRLVGLSGFSSAVHRDRCLEVGIDDYYEKPIDAATLEGLFDRLRPRGE